MKIRRVAADIFHTDRRTEKQADVRTDCRSNRHKGANNRFSQLSNTPKKARTLAQALCSARPRA